MDTSLVNDYSAGISWDPVCEEIDLAGLNDSCLPSSAAEAQRIDENPTINPSVSHLLAFLEEEEEDNPADDEANLTLSTLFAFHSKVSELASILKEDSPGLNLNFAPPFHRHIPSLSQVLPLDTPNSSCQTQQLWLPPAQKHAIDKLAFPMPGLQSRMLEPPLWSSSMKFFDEELCKSLPASTMPHLANNNANSRDGRRGSKLKPRKEANKLAGKPKLDHLYVDLSQVLLRCAKSIGSNDYKTAMDALVKVKQHACSHGDGQQRMAYYFSNALEARLQGTGWQVYWGQMQQRERASPMEIFKATCMYMCNSPFAKAFRYFVNQHILNAAKEASILHILEHQFTGFQYPSLFKALAERTGGPPQVRLIAGRSPHYSMTSSQMELLHNNVEHTGHQLKACAAAFGVPFHFVPWVGKTGTFNMRDYVDPNRPAEEVLVILSVYPLSYLHDDLLNPPQKRQQTLHAVRSMNPDAFIRGFVTASYSTPFFYARFREALYHFEHQYDILDTFIERDNSDRSVFESEILGRAILNLVACEEVQVVEKAEKYNQCYASLKTVGLEQVPFKKELKCKIQNILSNYHKHYFVGEDLNYLLMGWKGRTLHALAVWKGAKVSDGQ